MSIPNHSAPNLPIFHVSSRVRNQLCYPKCMITGILRYAEEIGHVAKTCRYFGIDRSSFYRWRQAYAERGEAGLINAPPIPKWHANRTPPEREDKVLYLRRKYHLGPMRIVWYLERCHDIKVSDATVSRILRRNGLTRLPRGTRMRKVHTKRYQKQVPGHHIQMDVKS